MRTLSMSVRTSRAPESLVPGSPVRDPRHRLAAAVRGREEMRRLWGTRCGSGGQRRADCRLCAGGAAARHDGAVWRGLGIGHPPPPRVRGAARARCRPPAGPSTRPRRRSAAGRARAADRRAGNLRGRPTDSRRARRRVAAGPDHARDRIDRAGIGRDGAGYVPARACCVSTRRSRSGRNRSHLIRGFTPRLPDTSLARRFAARSVRVLTRCRSFATPVRRVA